MKRILLFTLLCFTLSYSYAQYEIAIGAIGGKDGYGLSYKQFVQPEQDFQINLLYKKNFSNYDATLIGLYELHKEIHASTLHTTNLSWSFGGGFHVGYGSAYTNVESKYRVGLDLALGLEYNIDVIPFTIGAQLRPYGQYNTGDFNDPYRYWGGDASIIFRYILR